MYQNVDKSLAIFPFQKVSNGTDSVSPFPLAALRDFTYDFTGNIILGPHFM